MHTSASSTTARDGSKAASCMGRILPAAGRSWTDSWTSSNESHAWEAILSYRRALTVSLGNAMPEEFAATLEEEGYPSSSPGAGAIQSATLNPQQR